MSNNVRIDSVLLSDLKGTPRLLTTIGMLIQVTTKDQMEDRQRHRPTGWRRYWLMAVDSAARASFHKNNATPTEWIATLRAPGSVKLAKFMAGIHLLDYVIPGLEEQCADVLLDFRSLPLADHNMVMIGAGFGQNVFLFNTCRGKMVLKIDRESQALDTVRLLSEARRIKAEHAKIWDWYQHVEGVIPRESFCLVNGPLKGRRALATIQPYIEGPLRGVFEDFDEAELIKLIRAHETLRQVLILFLRRTTEIYLATGECIDLLGERNLCIRGNDQNPSLYFGDAHDIYGVGRISRYPDRRGTLEGRIAYLEHLLQVTI